MRHDLEWLKHQPIAHRGLHNASAGIPGNSIAAFEAAIAKGFAIELDVQVLPDQEVIVFHDYNLARMCDYSREVNSLNVGVLSKYPLGGTTQQIPLLRDVLRIVDGRSPLLIEIKKSGGAAESNMIIANLLHGYRGKFAVMSFNPFTLRWFTKYAPAIVRGQLSSDFRNEKLNLFVKYLLRNYKLNFLSQPHFIAHDIRNASNPVVYRLRRRGLPVLGWTVSTVAEEQVARSFADNIIFEGF